MSLEQLDAFLAFARNSSDLQANLQEPLDLEAFLALARGAGYALTEDAVRLVRENGAKTVNMSTTSDGGRAIVERLKKNKIIGKEIQKSASGKIEYEI